MSSGEVPASLRNASASRSCGCSCTQWPTLGTPCARNSLHTACHEARQAGASARVEVSSVSTIAVEVIAQIATALHIEASTVTPGASLAGDLGADSLDSVALVMAIEDHFSIDLPDEEMLELGTVGQVIEYVELAVAMRQPAPA